MTKWTKLLSKWNKKVFGRENQSRLRRFEVVYREQVWCKTDQEAARLVMDKLKNQQVELMVKQFTSKEGADVDKAILTFVKAAGLPITSEVTESEITETKTTKTRL